MVNTNTSQVVFFVGIKGVGMTPLALMYQDMGYQVIGSDTSDTQITDEILAQRKIKILPFGKLSETENIDKVIYSGAYKLSQNPDLIQAQTLKLEIVSQALALADIVNSKKSICVCGVGGKTTTTSMLATVLDQLNLGSWFVGVSQINSKLVSGKWRDDQIIIVEADEYAIDAHNNHLPKFSLYNPQLIICTNLAFDHPDIYTDFNHTLKTYADFFNRIPQDGFLIIKPEDLAKIKKFLKHELQIVTYGFGPKAEWQLQSLDKPNNYLVENNSSQHNLKLSVMGQMNATNALASLIALEKLNISITKTLPLISNYSGAKRRLELIRIDPKNNLYFDDYGHHPDEIRVTLEALRQTYPNHHLRVIFHPHTYSRTKAMFEEFAIELSKANEIILAPIFSSAREVEDASISHHLLGEKIVKKNQTKVKTFKSFDEIIDYLKQTITTNQLILTLGAGDIYKIHSKL